MDRAHLKTRGSGGNDFSDTNAWILLCRKHHIMQGADGWWKFCNKYPHLFMTLRDQGWIFEEIFGVMKLLKVKK